MSDWTLAVDSKKIASQFTEMQAEIEGAVNKAVGALAAATHAKTMELATDKLKSTAQQYKDALSFEKIDKNIWVVSLDMKKAGWLEDGRKAGFMEELLRGKSAKMSSSGKKYAVIPFQHNKGPSKQTPKAQELTGQIRQFLKAENVPYQKLEFNADGSPKMGLLHRFDIKSAKPSLQAKFPALSGLAIYQKKDASGQVKKQIMTFRIITEDMKEDGRWNHPGSAGKHLIDEAFFWAIQEWDSNILPSVLNRFNMEDV